MLWECQCHYMIPILRMHWNGTQWLCPKCFEARLDRFRQSIADAAALSRLAEETGCEVESFSFDSRFG